MHTDVRVRHAQVYPEKLLMHIKIYFHMSHHFVIQLPLGKYIKGGCIQINIKVEF